MKLILTRHGESEANVKRVFANTEDDKYPLTPKGRLQAEQLAEQLAGVSIAAIYSSPLLRALQTAEIIGQKFNLRPLTNEGLREVYVGGYENLSYGAEDAWRINDVFDVQAKWLTGEDPYGRAAGGENYFEVKDRWLNDFIGLVSWQHSDDDTVLGIAHAGVLAVTLPLLVPGIALTVSNEFVGHCQIIEIEYHASKTASGN